MTGGGVIDAGWHPLVNGVPPVWARAWGEDEFGVYAAFYLGDVVQRLRWIPPGRFWMGSPEGEAGRWDYEGPRHLVTIGSGFWMMDAPVRQSLWQAVMGDNPSRFKSPDRPVENVSWEMAGEFLSRLNGRVAGLELALPSEAQWEYACRAGSETATYAGDLEILGAHNAPVLDAIAWYGGNSGVGFDLKEGADSSGWADKQYPDSPSGTHPVGKKHPNAFGLHDMLGNVWEWCADHYHNGYDGAPTDGSAWIDSHADAAADRVMRGGSWIYDARSVRAACRSGDLPASRFVDVGFRCVRVHS
jgi:formylglycine-generating enzyme required for sulfatase activity